MLTINLARLEAGAEQLESRVVPVEPLIVQARRIDRYVLLGRHHCCALRAPITLASEILEAADRVCYGRPLRRVGGEGVEVLEARYRAALTGFKVLAADGSTPGTAWGEFLERYQTLAPRWDWTDLDTALRVEAMLVAPLWPTRPRSGAGEVQAERLRTDPAEPATKQPEPGLAGPPKRLLQGWHDITDAVGLRYADRDKIKGLNERFEGPIRNSGRGTSPLVDRNELLNWWNSLTILQEQLANQRNGARLSAEAGHNYGRDGTAAPEIGGAVKKRRADRRT
jgi:hypothetical protein